MTWRALLRAQWSRAASVAPHAPLLGTLILVILLSALVTENWYSRLWVVAAFVAATLSAVRAVGVSTTTGRRVLVFALMLIAADILVARAPSHPVIVTVGGLRAVFLAFVAISILSQIVRTQHVTRDTIFGGICIYLLIGLFFQSVFDMIETLYPGSFRMGELAISDLPGAMREDGRHAQLLYYSFITLTTVGFGDITPTWSLPQTLSIAEAVIGQLYLTILVASLVGMRLSARSNRQ